VSAAAAGAARRTTTHRYFARVDAEMPVAVLLALELGIGGERRRCILECERALCDAELCGGGGGVSVRLL
jgi:hypothetical protein